MRRRSIALNTTKKLRFLSALAAGATGFTAGVAGLSLGLQPANAVAQLQIPPVIAPPADSAQLANQPAPSQVAPATPGNVQNLAPLVPPSGVPTLPPIVSSDSAPNNPLRDQAVNFTAQAKLALTRGDIAGAKSLIEKANALRVPDSAYQKGQTRPWQIAMEIDRAERLRASGLQPAPLLNNQNGLAQLPPTVAPAPNAAAPSNGVVTAGATMPVNGAPNAFNQPPVVSNGVFQPKQDGTQIKPAAAQVESAAPSSNGLGESLYRDGLSALSGGDRERAVKLFSEAWKHERELDPAIRAQLKDKLMLLQANTAAANSKPNPSEPVTAIQEMTQEQNLTRQKMFREVSTEIFEAEKMVQDDPNAALDRLQSLRTRVSQSNIDGATRKTYLAMVDRVINNIQAYVDLNRPSIEQAERNRVIEDKIALDAATKAKVDSETQSMVDQYNDLFAKKQFAEAEMIAKKVSQLSPDTEISAVMLAKATMARRIQEQELIRAEKAENFSIALENVDKSSTPFDDNTPYLLPDAKVWIDKTKSRSKLVDDYQLKPAEKLIREKLNEQVTVAFDGRPLTQAMQTLSQMTGIPIYVDPLGLSAEGIASDQRVSLDLNGQSISLKSALNLILEPLNLAYVVGDEVLKITSRETSSGERRTKTYNVRDLVIPIPNFVSDYNTGLAGALQSAYQATNSMLAVKTQDISATQMNQQVAGSGGAMSPNSAALGQFGGVGNMPNMPGGMMRGNSAPVMGSSSPFLNGNGGNGFGGGGSLANFSELISLIQTTVDSNWESDGGEDTIRESTANLSLIVSAPLETHEAIADLLKQLRSLQNLQVTIEVRFITLSDTFFEQMGVDFDFNITDKKRFDGDGIPRRIEGSSTVGLSGPTTAVLPQLTTNLDVEFRNNSFGTATPRFGGPSQIGSIGFAILSDLELFFFLQASQGDSRTNILQAPKVTMFDGQIASVNDFAQRPFVISLQPVVGDFAVAQQPIIAVLNDGTTLNVQSVVSQDKRYVRLTLNPSFTRIEDADNTFTFSGRTSSKTGSTVIGPDGKPTTNRDDEETITEGSTVQLPTLGVTSVSTTVNVPDGGTILLGGIKRLRESRGEQGVPILSKIPYINRLFKNVGIGRETNTLMMTVTPRIIIPEEEEANVIGSAQP
jgi:general secretion pathway protein D